MNPNQHYLSLLGLCMRAGELVTGEELTLEAVRKKNVALVLLASDASENTAKKVRDKCSYYHVPLFAVSDRYELGSAIGKEARVVIGIRSKGFAKKIAALLNQ